MDTGGEDDGYLAFVGGPERVTGLTAFDRPKQFRRGRQLMEAGANWAAVEDVRW